MKLPHRFQLRLHPTPPYNFTLTVQKPAGWSLFTPFEVYEQGVLWTALHLDDTLVGLKLRSQGTTRRPVILIDVFTKRPCPQSQRRAIQEALASRLTTSEDLSGFYRMARRDPILRHTLANLYGMHDTGPSHLFAAATLAVLLQMAPLKRSEQMMDCVIRHFGEPAQFDGRSIRVSPTPRQIAKARVQGLRRCRLGYRAKYLVRIARTLTQGDFPTLEGLSRLSAEEAKATLRELSGVGDYSADIITPHNSFPIDVWSADVFGKLFFGREPKAGRDAIDRIKAEGLKRWGEYAWLGFFYVVQDLEGLSKKLQIPLRLQ